jgi:UDP-galactopyranose mutase
MTATHLSDLLTGLSAAPAGRTALVVGAGVTGATVANVLRTEGWRVQVVEKETTWGGQLRTARAAGVPYEPHGAHIMHTSDEEVWRFITAHVPVLPYRHKVRTVIEGDRELSWPPQRDELRQLKEWVDIEQELDNLPAAPDPANFERWCVSVMGRTLYELFIYGYTCKQWGREPHELDASFAPKRIELRTDGYTDLFRDPYQGWADHIRFVDSLLAGSDVALGEALAADDVDDLARSTDAVVVTAPLDDLFGNRHGRLEWRGVELKHVYRAEGWPHQSAGVVNRPTLETAYTRTIETRHMSVDLDREGPAATVVSYEYPGAPAKHYPVNDVEGRNRALQRRYEEELAGLGGNVYAAGRLARYVYIDIDQAVRQGLNTARRILSDLG